MAFHHEDRDAAGTAIETIAAISTPPGRGGMGVVRLAGPEAVAVAGALVRVAGPLEHGRARFARVVDRAQAADPEAPPLDQAVVTLFRGPHSYTGDDVVEIAAHGSPVVLEAILGAALERGARLARPGEFTERAFLAGKLDLAEAAPVHDLIAAQTLEQARAAAQQMGGALSRRVEPVRDGLMRLLVLLEAGLDFASGELDDVDVVPPETIASALREIREPLEELRRSFRGGALLRQGAALALVGRPNAGKSSLFNRLLRRPRAIVTPVPGTTRDTVEEVLSLRGVPVRLIDTAGLRLADEAPADEAERQGISRSREALADADLVVLVHDAAVEWSSEEMALLAELAGRPHLVVANKVDLVAGAVVVGQEAFYYPQLATPSVGTSALTGEGLEAVETAILAALGAEGGIAASGALNSLRHEQAVRECLGCLATAEEANAAGLPHEMLALDLHNALRALDAITGATTPDDILARIFSAFCIGK